MDNFNLAPVTVWALSAVKRDRRLTLKWQLLLARSLSVQMLEEVISSPILYLINNFKEN